MKCSLWSAVSLYSQSPSCCTYSPVVSHIAKASHMTSCGHWTWKCECCAGTYFSHFMIWCYFIARLYGQVNDPAMLKRLQTEYDAFFVRATRCIFSSKRLGAWQYLAVVPYNTVSLPTLWRIFYSLHEEYQEEDSLVAGTDTKTGDHISGIFASFRTVSCQLTFRCLMSIIVDVPHR